MARKHRTATVPYRARGARGAQGANSARSDFGAAAPARSTHTSARTLVKGQFLRVSFPSLPYICFFQVVAAFKTEHAQSVCTHHSHVSKTIKPRGTFTARQNDHIALTPRLRLRRRGCTPRTWDRQAGKAGWVTGRLGGCSMPVSCVILVLTHPRREAAVPFCDIKRGHDKPTRVLIMPVP